MGGITSTISSCIPCTAADHDNLLYHQASPPPKSHTPPPLRSMNTDSDDHGVARTGDTIGNYLLLNQLGRGHFSTVFAAKHVVNRTFHAAKVMPCRSFTSAVSHGVDFRREVAVMASLDHPNIIRLHDIAMGTTEKENKKDKAYHSGKSDQADHADHAGHADKADTVAVVMELAGSGTLHSIVEQEGYLEEDEARVYMRDLANAVKHCHERGVYHRDLKLENILVTATGTVKLSDFGLAVAVDVRGMQVRGSSGTKEYAAPEVLFGRGLPYDGAKADAFSLGVILFIMVHGYRPFGRQRDEKGVIMTDDAPTFDEEVSGELVELLKGLLMSDASKRTGVDGILEHRWMQHTSTGATE